MEGICQGSVLHYLKKKKKPEGVGIEWSLKPEEEGAWRLGLEHKPDRLAHAQSKLGGLCTILFFLP